jgi:hypothetical protein
MLLNLKLITTFIIDLDKTLVIVISKIQIEFFYWLSAFTSAKIKIFHPSHYFDFNNKKKNFY